MKPEPATAAHPAAILAIILVSYFMILLDNSVIFTALPSLQAELQRFRVYRCGDRRIGLAVPAHRELPGRP
ncbi:hypothetical protein [Arthrobacter globiformis]|uniref:hypothetical protein n=1 Tax=Arthrobacter globiformis TaxID=1665 RepID=UPI0027D7A52F|nr:hypothetical protein [Arthrobacter globiformis]